MYVFEDVDEFNYILENQRFVEFGQLDEEKNLYVEDIGVFYVVVI